MHALERRLKSHRDFEAVQSLIAVFLRIKAEVLIQNVELEPLLRSMLEAERKESRRIIELLTSSLGILSFVRNID
jgi:U3 small nucleolar RNA-associated protein 21